MSIAQPTLEDVWQLFRETDRKFQENAIQTKETERFLKELSAETDRRFQESDRSWQETKRFLKEQSAETDRKFQESDRSWQETKRFLKEQTAETERLLKEQSAETERLLKEQSAETDRRFRETDRAIKKVTESVGKLSNRLGEFVENAVRPAAVRLFQERKIAVHEIYPNVSVQRGNEGLEIDLLVVNDQDAVVIECKSNLSVEDIKDHIERLNKVKRLMPKYANSKIFGAVASMVLSNEIIKYAHRQGLFVIGQSGDDLLIYNDDNFVPKIW